MSSNLTGGTFKKQFMILTKPGILECGFKDDVNGNTEVKFSLDIQLAPRLFKKFYHQSLVSIASIAELYQILEEEQLAKIEVNNGDNYIFEMKKYNVLVELEKIPNSIANYKLIKISSN